jgi:capsular polysaccharide export protein
MDERMKQAVNSRRCFGVSGPGLARVQGLETFLESGIRRVRWTNWSGLDGFVGWGRRPHSDRARALAERSGLPFFCVEDGFLRSVGLGSEDAPLSVVVDDLGIYFDATRPSRFEALMQPALEQSEVRRAETLQIAWCAARVSKYNHLREHSGPLPRRYVLVIDQTFGDASISFGLAKPGTFMRMLRAALDENPDCSIVVKIHPDVFSGKKRGHFDIPAIARMDRVEVLTRDVHPVRLVEHCEAVYVVTSQLGFEALLWGKRVRAFGMPFYAGWGLTTDDMPRPLRRSERPLAQLVHAALIGYPRYIDPEARTRCEVERVVEWMGLQRRMRERFPSTVYAVGFSWWKRPLVRIFLQGSRVSFVQRPEQIPQGGTAVVWGRRQVPQGVPVVRLEDGFLRSAGLGAHLIRPLSWVQDSRGIYFDATVPSDLEVTLESANFDATELLRAHALRVALIKSGLTKYNLSGTRWTRPLQAIGKKVILVPGQVESDASLAWGAPDVARNMTLLQRVREANPEAWVVYKPHPDVVAGMRKGGQREGDALRWSDEVVMTAPMGQLLDEIDEVHTMTSLAGFEALLRGRPVVCYGQPFYAGWGLTQDLLPFPNGRRGRAIDLDCLVAGALLKYPSYVSFVTGRYMSAERALQELHVQSNNANKGVFRRAFRYGLKVGLAGWAFLAKK